MSPSCYDPLQCMFSGTWMKEGGDVSPANFWYSFLLSVCLFSTCVICIARYIILNSFLILCICIMLLHLMFHISHSVSHNQRLGLLRVFDSSFEDKLADCQMRSSCSLCCLRWSVCWGVVGRIHLCLRFRDGRRRRCSFGTRCRRE